MLKVYFTAATSYDGELQDYYQKILAFLSHSKVRILSGFQVIDSKLKEKDKKLSKKEIYERENRLMQESDFIIAEVSKPSLGVGAEINQAINYDKCVLALVNENFAQNLSPIIAGNQSENLFVEYYNFDKLSFQINDFLTHIRNLKNKKGKLIVIEGSDNSGKTVQTKLLVEYLKNKNIPVKYIDFPQYYHSFHGRTVAKFLRGEFGKIDEVSPYLASLAYALDRASVKQEMDEFLNKGGYIITNRYVESNMAHQGVKLKEGIERQKFLKWIYDLEYKIHKLPREDIVIYLDVPFQISSRLASQKTNRPYLKGKSKDIHEKDPGYLQKVEKMYQFLSTKYKNWKKIDCTIDNNLLNIDEIHKKILDVLHPLFSI